MQIVGVFDPDAALQQKYAEQYHAAGRRPLRPISATMLDRAKPEAVASFTSTADHPVGRRGRGRASRPRDDGEAAGGQHRATRSGSSTRPSAGGIQVLRQLRDDVVSEPRRDLDAVQGAAARPATSARWWRWTAIEGPKEINVQPEFFDWLTDPVKNGARRALRLRLLRREPDDVADGQPAAARGHRASRSNSSPTIYPRVDDEATILVEYPKAQGIIQASWNWPFSRKDFEVYGEHGSAIATTGGGGLRVTLPKEPEHAVDAGSAAGGRARLDLAPDRRRARPSSRTRCRRSRTT